MSRDLDMMAAVSTGDLARVRSILNEEPALANARNEGGDSAVLVAAYRGHEEILKTLLSSGALLDLFEAAAVGDADAIEASLKGDAPQVDQHSHDGWTPLHLAAFFGHEDVAELLLARGAEIDARSQSRRFANANTPLHAAVAGGRLKVAEALVKHGADVNLRDGSGWTPLLMASNDGNAELVTLLLTAGADVNADNDGKTALALADTGGHRETAALLRAKGTR